MKASFPVLLVTPVHKSGDAQVVSNYSPISILHAASKILEKAVAEELTAQLESKAHLHPLQVGFKKKLSTDTACCCFLKDN